MPIIGKRYAEALADTAFFKGIATDVRKELEEVSDLIGSADNSFRKMLANPGIPKDKRKKALMDVFEGRYSTETTSFLMLLVDNGRMSHLGEIRREFVKIADARENVLNMTIYSALPLTAEETQRISGIYMKRHGASSVNVTHILDGQLIGGIKVKVGDNMTDASLKGKLEDLKRLFAATGQVSRRGDGDETTA